MRGYSLVNVQFKLVQIRIRNFVLGLLYRKVIQCFSITEYN